MSDAGPPELSRMVDPRLITTRPVLVEANEAECVALARRFALVSVDRLRAELALEPDGEQVTATGRLQAAIVQSCAISGNDLPVTVDEELRLVFVPEPVIEAEELELEEADLDQLFYSGGSFDIGEAVAQSLALAIDPYACGPDADRVRDEAGLNAPREGGPFAALAALRKP
ncbi:DNA-binding protein [Croceibacterium mercuriale]|uniref:DNA-binding protein n=1 Tax=Croceibacterium mercuriale TaxID=1572751 RepID=A0A0B2BX46_9SPHN|nr:YceD family protein [Croceibacterium mercuriale]KHL24440.1 DNA-binding protein [Croceibacterium mercuriale]